MKHNFSQYNDGNDTNGLWKLHLLALPRSVRFMRAQAFDPGESDMQYSRLHGYCATIILESNQPHRCFLPRLTFKDEFPSERLGIKPYEKLYKLEAVRRLKAFSISDCCIIIVNVLRDTWLSTQQ